MLAIHGVSQRRACKALAVDRSSVRYRSVRPADTKARGAMKRVAAERWRFCYRRIHVMLVHGSPSAGILADRGI